MQRLAACQPLTRSRAWRQDAAVTGTRDACLHTMKILPHTRSCFVCGEANPAGLRLRFETDGQVVTARFTPRPEHIGFKQVVHGGIVATLLDEIMVRSEEHT